MPKIDIWDHNETLDHEAIQITRTAEVQALVRLIRTARVLDRAVLLDITEDEKAIEVSFIPRAIETGR